MPRFWINSLHWLIYVGKCFWKYQLLHAGTHYSDVTVGLMTSTVTSLVFVYSTVYSGADQRKHQMPRPHSADHFRRSFMIVAEPSDRGLLLLISGTKCCPIPPVRLKYDCFTNTVRDWYDWSVWPALRMFSAIIGTTTGKIDAIAMWTIALTLFFATTIETTPQIIARSLHAFGNLHTTTERYIRPPVRYRYDVTDQRHDHASDRGDRLNRLGLMGE